MAQKFNFPEKLLFFEKLSSPYHHLSENREIFWFLQLAISKGPPRIYWLLRRSHFWPLWSVSSPKDSLFFEHSSRKWTHVTEMMKITKFAVFEICPVSVFCSKVTKKWRKSDNFILFYCFMKFVTPWQCKITFNDLCETLFCTSFCSISVDHFHHFDGFWWPLLIE